MEVEKTTLDGVLLIKPKIFGDERGFFLESYHSKRYAEHGLPEAFVQDNVSVSQRGVLRGLHFQNPNGQGKLVSVLQGEVFDVAVDVRVGSPTFGKWVGVFLNSQTKHQFYVPPGFAHGFCVTSESAMFFYKCTAFYDPANEHGILWNDPEIGIDWPLAEPTLSGKDAIAPTLGQFPKESLPSFTTR